MATIHILLQGKGGVGKTFAATMLAQYKSGKGEPTVNIDTDPVNSTFHGFKALNVKRIDLLEGDEINTRHFDALVDLVASANADVIVDNGASSFVPLSHYLISNRVPSLFAEMGHQTMVHTMVTGGQSSLDTVHGFAQLAMQFPRDAMFVVWLNPFWGPVELDGIAFEQMKAYVTHKVRVSAIVQIPALKVETYGRDLSDMLQERLTFSEAIAMDSLTIMARQRLKIIQTRMFEQLANTTVL